MNFNVIYFIDDVQESQLEPEKLEKENNNILPRGSTSLTKGRTSPLPSIRTIFDVIRMFNIIFT